jgi:hypothetical protein
MVRALAVTAAVLLGLAVTTAVAALMAFPGGGWSAGLTVAGPVLAALALLAAFAAGFARWQPIGIQVGPPMVLTGVHAAFIEALQEHRTREPGPRADSPFEGL